MRRLAAGVRVTRMRGDWPLMSGRVSTRCARSTTGESHTDRERLRSGEDELSPQGEGQASAARITRAASATAGASCDADRSYVFCERR